ncbi:MAG: CotH kinase family protein [Phycisphaerales bacterium JB060]
MPRHHAAATVATAACLLLAAGHATAQDLYDIETLRTFRLSFHDADWEQRLRDNYFSETLIGADLEVDGETYPNVGVRIRGNTSYTALPAGSQKFSLKIDVDWMEDQKVMGYDNLNLNNGFRDPTFCREVAYNNYVAQFIPNPRANHVLVELNGQNWGVYVNTQQPDKDMLEDWFADDDGVRIKCANNPFGPGLQYRGTSPFQYRDYEIQNDGGLADPLATLIEVCDAVTNWPLGEWETIDTVFAIDPSAWSVALENLLTDDDSYSNKGCDFMTYRDPIDGRTHLLQRDANETWTDSEWSPTRNFTAFNKPVLSHVLSVPELRQRYLAHYRTAMEGFSWDELGPQFLAMRDRIDAHVQADPKKIYSYDLFEQNFFTSVILPFGGLGGGSVVGLEQFVDERFDYLSGNAELMARGPAIVDLFASNDEPAPGEPVTITATVLPDGSVVQGVDLYYRPTATAGFERIAMDWIGGDDYEAVLPIMGVGGQRVLYYVGATADNAYESLSFYPAGTEWAALELEYQAATGPGIRITEWMYSGDSGEFVELTNTSGETIDMAGWSFDDSNREVGAFDLSGFGVVEPGQSVILTEALADGFRAAWGLDAGVAIVDLLGVTEGHNLGRNDEINIFDADGGLADRLTYGDEDFDGSIRTRDASGQACASAIGANDVFAWSLSEAGDAFGSWAASTGELGTPGVMATIACEGCPPDLDGDGELTIFDFLMFQNLFDAMDPRADFDEDGMFTLFDFLAFQNAFDQGCAF